MSQPEQITGIVYTIPSEKWANDFVGDEVLIPAADDNHCEFCTRRLKFGLCEFCDVE